MGRKISNRPLVIKGAATVLNGSIRYGVSRNVEAEDEQGRPTKIALVVIERENGEVQSVAVQEALIRFAGIGIIEDEVRRVVGL